MSASAVQESILSNLHSSKWITSQIDSKANSRIPLDERMKRLEGWDLNFITATLNDDLIQQGRAYSCEQAYPIRAKFGVADREIAKLLEGEFRKFVALTPGSVKV